MRPILTFLLFASFFLLLNHARGFAITGISAAVNNVTGERPFRHDINELYMSGPAWDLFILALRDFQQVSQDNPLSYYQVAGKAVDVVVENQFDEIYRNSRPPTDSMGWCNRPWRLFGILCPRGSDISYMAPSLHGAF